jgi:transcriptional regulator with XRE-family HTH domain
MAKKTAARETSGDGAIDPADVAYSRRVGERLRAIRRQKKLSLQDVDEMSTGEFKASVVGAYERGERAISLPRLQRLADVYSVPVAQLLPFDESEPGLDPDSVSSRSRKLAIDLVRLAEMTGPSAEMLTRFLSMIQVQRGDFNGKVLTIRAHDVRAIAAMLDVPLEDVTARLDALELLYRPKR